MTLSMPIAFGCFALFVAFVSASHRRRSVSRSREGAGEEFRYLIHAINDDRCTGCATCVEACPTNVLQLQSHKTRATRFEDCVQCEKCSRVCPTQALAMHLIGDKPPTIKVPNVDQHFQTTVQGQYLIGEVSGKPLVKNAANLGRMVVEHIVQSELTPIAAPSDTNVDVVIVGSGPGGLSAALACERHGLSYVVLEKERIMAATVLRYPAGKPFMAEPHDCRNLSFLPVFDTSKETLVGTWRELVRTLNVRLQLGEAVETVKRNTVGVFDTVTTKCTYSSQRVILAIGVRGKPRTLKVPGEEQRKVHMLLEDPADHQGQHVLVVGGGDSALEAAVALASVGATVTLSYRKKEFSRAKAKNRADVVALCESGRMTVLFKSGVKAIGVRDVRITLASGEESVIENDACFILIGADPPVKWLSRHGVAMVERPHSYSAGASDELVSGLVAGVSECAQTASEAATAVRGSALPAAEMPLNADPVSGSVTRVRRPPRRASTLSGLCKRLRDAVLPRQSVAGEESSVDTVVFPLPRPRPATLPGFEEPTHVDPLPAAAFTHEFADRSPSHEW